MSRKKINMNQIVDLEDTIYSVQNKLNSKQDSLESGVNIKTINGESLIGSEDIIINSPDISQLEGQVAVIQDSMYSLQSQLNSKQAALISSENIKTINGESILGSGDIVITGGTNDDYVTRFELTDQYISLSNVDSALSNRITTLENNSGGDTTSLESRISDAETDIVNLQNEDISSNARIENIEDNFIQSVINKGTGVGVYKDKSIGGIANFKTLKGGTNITIDNSNADEILISSTASGGGSAAVTDEQVIQAVNYSISPQSGGPGIGTIAVIGFTSQVSLAGATISQVTPSGIKAGDALFAFVASGSLLNNTIDWTIIASETTSISTGTKYLYLLRKNSVTENDSSFNFTFTADASSRMSLNYIVLRSSTGVVEVREFATKYNGTPTSSSISFPTLTATDNEIFLMGAVGNSASISPPTAIPVGTTLYSGNGNITYYTMPTLYQERNAGESNSSTLLTWNGNADKSAIICRVGVGSIATGRTLTPLDVFSKSEMRNLLSAKLDITKADTYEPIMTGKTLGFAKWSGTAWTWDASTYALNTHTHSYLALNGGTMSGNLTISAISIPAILLQDSDATATFNKSSMTNENGILKFNTYNSSSALVSTDYQIDKNASGASVHRFRIANVDKMLINGTELTPGADAGLTLGTAALRWGQIYSSAAAISTSDRNYKTDILNIDEQEKLVATKLKNLFKKFKYKDSVVEKGLDSARIHIGLIAQEVRDTFIEFGLDPNKYGMFCEDVWYEYEFEEVSKYEVDDVTYEKVDIVTKISKEPVEGSVMKTRLALRYEELLCFIISAI